MSSHIRGGEPRSGSNLCRVFPDQLLIKGGRCCRQPEKQGVILLIALLMLSLFMLLGTSYVLTANRRRPCSAVAGAVGSKTEDAAQDTTTKVTDTTLTGQPDGASNGGSVGDTGVIRVRKYFTNSVLADKYGDWYEQTKLSSITRLTLPGNAAMAIPFYTIDVTGTPTFGPATTIANWKIANPGTSPDLGTHVGRILTIESELVPNAVFRIVAQKGTRYLVHAVDPTATFVVGDLVTTATAVTIQGREFSGDTADIFQLHENYDAPDNRNLFLAWMQSDAVLGRDQQPGTGDEPAEAHRFVVPSFHRPDKLLETLKSNPTTFYTDWLQDPINQSISMLRPEGKMSWNPGVDWSRYGLTAPPTLPTGNSLEHPNFTGGNVTSGATPLYFDPIHGPWDVDNDGDGVTDSIWLDVGMSPVSIGNAQVQPLVAVMILDLDGRINLNAHGTDRDLEYLQIRSNPQEVNSSLAQYRYAGTVSSTTSGTAGPKGATLPSAQGWGVADIDPRLLFLGAGTANSMKSLLQGSVSTGSSSAGGRAIPSIKAEGRFGDSARGSGVLAPASGFLGKSDAGIDAPGAQPRDVAVPDTYGSGPAFRSPVDPHGRMTVGLDQMGQPFFNRVMERDDSSVYRGPYWDHDKIDDPYDISLGRRAPRPGWSFDPDVQTTPSTLQDNLFAAPQFERLLRLFEPAAEQLSPRLVSLLGANAEQARVAATIESWDTPAVTIPRSRLEPLLGLSDQGNAARKSLVSWDLALGLRMDVNRPFGDGLDNDSNGVVDEPGEYQAEIAADVYGTKGSAFEQQCLTNGHDVDGDGDADNDDQQRARELFARHLYVLARTMAPALPPKDAAQWAVNVVDMRDPDSIITRFPFDANSPGNAAWDPTTPDNEDNIVWGCERPDLLITETLAWRNIKYGVNPISGAPEYSDKGTGGLVVELYSPWTGRTTTGGALSSASPSEFMTKSDVASQGLTPAAFYFGGRMDLATLNSQKQPVFQIIAVREDPGAGSATLGSLEADPTWPAVDVTDGSIAGLVIYPAKTSGTAIPVTGSMGTFVSGTGPDVDATTVAPGQFALVSGPIKSGTVVANTIDISASGTAGMEFYPSTFSDKTSKQVMQIAGGITETISGSNGFSSDDRSCGNLQYPLNGSSGPVGAMICVEDPGKPASPLRFLAQSGTTNDLSYMAGEKYRILLRRLANPLAAHDPVLNPYICVDSMVVQDQAVVAGSPGPGGTLKSAERCASQPADKTVNNLWRQAATDDDANTAALAAPLLGAITGVEASLGFLPARLKIPSNADKPAEAEQPVFPWLTWLNREFASEHELLLVPKSSPSTLLRDHTHEWPFEHLFFQLGSGTSTPEKELEQNKVGILELLRVPSRFADAESRIPAADAIAISGTLVALGGRPMFLPPHNYLSHFREPGRVNLNTMSSSAVWAAVNKGLPGAPYEDEVTYGSDGTPLAFQKSEDWNLESGSRSSPLSGNWKVDAGEDLDNDNSLDVNHDENNDGQQQVSKSGMLRSIAASRRGWALADDGSTPAIAGQFDRVLNRTGVAADRLWFSKPFQSGWTSSGTAAYAADQSLLLRNWIDASDSANFVRMSRADNYSRLQRTAGADLTAFNVYTCTIRIRGDMPLDPMDTTHKLPEMLKNWGDAQSVSPSKVTASVANGVTTYTSSIIPPMTGKYNLQLAFWQKAQVDVLSVSLVNRGTETELLTNGDFSQGDAGWSLQDGVLQTGAAESALGPVYLMATNLALKDSKGKTQDGRPYADPRRNPFFRYREMMRLSNLTTPRSNVFAVWMTVGFFTIEPHPTRTGKTALGAEYGLDTGSNARFKSFMILDRSIPVGFRPGTPLNSRDAVLLEHFGN